MVRSTGQRGAVRDGLTLSALHIRVTQSGVRQWQELQRQPCHPGHPDVEASWLPLWTVPQAALKHLVARGILRSDRLLPPLPHPSGGNGENISWIRGTSTKDTFSVKRASTGADLLRWKAEVKAFFGQSKPPSAA